MFFLCVINLFLLVVNNWYNIGSVDGTNEMINILGGDINFIGSILKKKTNTRSN